MNAQRKRKEQTVSQLQSVFQEAKIILIAHYDGSSVAQLTDLRNELAQAGSSFQVTKNRLALRALSGTPAEPLKELFSGPTAIAIGHDMEQAPQVPKIIIEFGKKYERIRVCGAIMDGQLLDEAAVKRLANLPSMNDLRAKLIGLMTMPAAKLVSLFTQPASQLARLAAARSAQSD